MGLKSRLFKLAAVAGLAVAWSGQAFAVPFTLNNVFVSTGAGTVLEYTPTGTLVQTLAVGTGFITGSAFDASGNFYVTRFTNGALQKFNGAGTNLGALVSSLPTPESVVVDASGNLYVGNVGGGIRKYTSAGALLSTSISTTRVDFMDLAADQTTMLYTQEGGDVRRVDVASGTPLSAFSADVENAFALRIRSNGTVIVADGADLEVLDATGAQIGSYDPDGTAGGTWFAVNLDPDGTSFWAATTDGLVAHVDFASGTVLNSWTVTGTNGTWGLAVYGEVTQGGGGNTPEPGVLSLFGIGLLGLIAARRRRA